MSPVKLTHTQQVHLLLKQLDARLDEFELKTCNERDLNKDSELSDPTHNDTEAPLLDTTIKNSFDT